jgi:hypothetical protein
MDKLNKFKGFCVGGHQGSVSELKVMIININEHIYMKFQLLHYISHTGGKYFASPKKIRNLVAT